MRFGLYSYSQVLQIGVEIQGSVFNPFVDNKYCTFFHPVIFFRTKDSQRLVGAPALPFDSLEA